MDFYLEFLQELYTRYKTQLEESEKQGAPCVSEYARGFSVGMELQLEAVLDDLKEMLGEELPEDDYE